MNRRMLLLPVAAAAIGFALWRGNPANAPACTWRTGTGTEVAQGTNFAKLAPEAPIRLSLHTDEPLHVYVWSHSAEDGTLLLFPAPKLQTDSKNPLPAGQSVLPGRFDGKDLAWTTRSGILATTTYVAFASKEPLPELDALAGKVRQWSNSVFADRSMQVTKPTEGQDVLGKPLEGWAAPLLQRAADQLREQTDPNGPMQPLRDQPDVWISSWKVLQTR